MIFTIAGREIRSMFLSPLAWAIIGVLQFILSYLFAIYLQNFLINIQPQLHRLTAPMGITDFVIAPMYEAAIYSMMFTIPLITMRVISEEKRSHSLALLFSAPLSMTEIVVGKFLGVVGFLGIMLVIYSLMPLSLLLAGSIDWGLFASIVLGTFLMISACAAIGVFMSSLTAQPTIAAISTFGAILLLWILSQVGSASDTTSVMSYLSMLNHVQTFMRGIFNTSDFVYYLLVITIFVVLSIRRLDGDRLQR
ncbi:MAG: ABC transporter permease subunit [Gammaproteobacteria bacterium]|nr:ABC transporter permease subunit [Gammaproteobacteria bacterium]